MPISKTLPNSHTLFPALIWSLFGFTLLWLWMAGSVAFAQQNSTAAENVHPIMKMQRLVGEWQVFAEPDKPSDSVNEWAWANGRRAILKKNTILEGNRFLGNRPAPEQISQGLIGYNPASNRIVGTTYQTLIVSGDKRVHMVFESEYRFPNENIIRRLYTVTFPFGDRGIPLPENGGYQRSFRETYTFLDDNTIIWTTDILNNGEWENFGPNPNGSTLRRVMS